MITGLDIKNNRLICSECGSIIIKRYHRFDKSDKILCDNCLKKSVKCDICGIPTSLFENYDGITICPSCLLTKDECGCCNKELNRNNRKIIKGVSSFFCNECITIKDVICSKCKRPFKDEKDLILLDDNTYICPDCFSYHIYDTNIMKNILTNLLNIIKSLYNIDIKNELPVYLVSDVELKYLKKIKTKKVLLSPDNNGISVIDGKKPSIYIVKGLTLSKFITTLSNLYIFSYLSMYSTTIDKDVELGFSKWLTGKILFFLGYLYDYKQMIIEDALENGNNGFMKIKNVENDKGIDGVMNFVFTRKMKKLII